MHPRRLAVLSGLAGLLGAQPAMSQPAASARASASTAASTAAFDSIVRAEVAQRQFSGVVLVAEQGKTVFQAAVGLAGANAPMTEDARFRLASITKAFAAVLVMQLVEAQRLRESSTIAEVLPDLKIPRAEQITVHVLLLHRAGSPEEPDALYATQRSARAMVLETAKLPYRPYGEFAYANLDYLVLQLMIEKITGKPFAAVLQERILTPLGMTHTGMASRASTGIVQGYLADSTGRLTPEPSDYVENAGAAGAMYGTVADLLRFDQALNGERLLKKASIAEMYTSHPELGYVAYGSWVYDYWFLPSSPRVVERRGRSFGFNHTFIRMPGINKTLIILSNTDRFDPDTFGKLDSFKDRLIKALVERP
ncbi:serine hydrolase domain-containing protein [Gemmatimonas sp.]|uniref:serine hydrolase domain-containing protein n=1 Tax=Gemmatimonas sp. TaxID=1962908 RepID=UPI003340C5B4